MSARHKDPSRGGRVPVLVAVLLAAVVAGGGYWAYQKNGDASGRCDRVSVVVTPELQPTVSAAAKELARSSQDCVALAVSSATSAEVANGKLGSSLPDLWIPDSSAWLDRTVAGIRRPKLLVDSLASSPLVLVSGDRIEQPTSWLTALGSGTVAITDPLTTATGTGALLSVQAERATTHATDEQIGGVIVPTAQNHGAQSAPIRTTEDAFTAVTAPGSAVVAVVTEQAYLSYLGQHPGSTAYATTPTTGSALLDYPLASFAGGGARITRAGAALKGYLAGPGRTQLGQASFRKASGAPLGEGVGVGQVPLLTIARDPAAVQSTLRTWKVLTVPSRLLAVFDVSGSMDDRTGGRSRIDLTVEAAATGLQMFSSSAQIGAWAFSDGSLTGGRPYRELLAIRGLGEPVGGGTQRDALRSTMQRLPQLTQGGTALDDTVVAAYRHLQKTYQADAVNTVLLLTDGAEDGSSSISEQEAIATLKREYDPARPVHVIFIGISGDADVPALKRLSDAVHGRYYVARRPGDITKVFIDAFLSR
jgi:hypothetical protein